MWVYGCARVCKGGLVAAVLVVVVVVLVVALWVSMQVIEWAEGVCLCVCACAAAALPIYLL